MGYAFYLQKFEDGERSSAPSCDVISVLEQYGRVESRDGRSEFIPDGDDLCEVGFLSVSEMGVDGVSLERPIASERLPRLVFDLLGIEGFCFFEQDVSYVLARTDVTASLPEGLRELCSSGRCAVISHASEVTV
jgi:hypothetical protein